MTDPVTVRQIEPIRDERGTQLAGPIHSRLDETVPFAGPHA